MLNPIILIRSKFENMKNIPTSPYWPTVPRIEENTESLDQQSTKGRAVQYDILLDLILKKVAVSDTHKQI